MRKSLSLRNLPNEVVAHLQGLLYVRRVVSGVKVKSPNECWPWQKGTDSRGYGAIRILTKTVKCHRAIGMLFVAKRVLVPGECVCHSCDNPTCCNPNHLEIGDHTKNMRDMFSRNRRKTATGEQNGQSKLTIGQVGEIRRRYRKHSKTPGERSSDLAKEFGVTRQTITTIIRRESWNH